MRKDFQVTTRGPLPAACRDNVLEIPLPESASARDKRSMREVALCDRELETGNRDGRSWVRGKWGAVASLERVLVAERGGNEPIEHEVERILGRVVIAALHCDVKFRSAGARGNDVGVAASLGRAEILNSHREIHDIDDGEIVIDAEGEAGVIPDVVFRKSERAMEDLIP